jgi:CheY-like chemotaxis protein
VAAFVSIAGVRALVVDDDADARELVRRMLESSQAQVTTAASSEEAISFLREQPFDILVSDIGMPGEDGHALMRRIRTMTEGPARDIPAIALTAYARPEDRDKALGAGFQAHASKPVDTAALIATVARLAQRK